MSFQKQLSKAFQLFEESKYNESVRLYEALLGENLSIQEEINLRYGYGYPLSSLGKVEEAIANYETLQELGERTENLEIVSQAMHQIGMVYRQNKEYEIALDWFEEECIFIENHFRKNKLFLAVNTYELGYTNLLLGNLNLAYNYLKHSLKCSRDVEDSILTACALRGLGEYFVADNKKELAIEHFKESMKFFKNASDFTGEAEVAALLNEVDSETK